MSESITEKIISGGQTGAAKQPLMLLWFWGTVLGDRFWGTTGSGGQVKYD